MELASVGPADIVVFTGPTLSHAEGIGILPDAAFLEPAMQGDIYKAFELYKPRIIVLIDGYYENVPSVWHKEILYVMSQGCNVFGAASMGALRAAELKDFGMTGYGKIFEWFESELLEDDDEVALLHGPGEIGYPSISEPLVNIRATVNNAIAQGVMNTGVAEKIISIAKSMFYKKRKYYLIKEEFDKSYPNNQEEYYFKWLEENNVNQKNIDARGLLLEIEKLKKDEISLKKVLYNFSETIYWRRSVELSK